jgi:hypothetical protein
VLRDNDYNDIRQALIEDVRRDYVGLWVVPWLIERLAPCTEQSQIKSVSLGLVEDLLKERLMRAGLPVKTGRGFIEWDMPIPEILDRIDAEWTRLGRTPNIGEIVWFDKVTE